jgi:hypothetical protein
MLRVRLYPITVIIVAVGLLSPSLVAAAESDGPTYRPSGRSPEPLDIRTNAYGASALAPLALEIGDRAADFTVPLSGGGSFSLANARSGGPTVIVFYRGHW